MVKFYFRYFIFLLLLLTTTQNVFSQGRNHQWLLGYISNSTPYSTSLRSRFLFSVNNSSIVPDNFKMKFDCTQGNICDENGNFLFASNGEWIMDSTGDTLLNGSGLNPGQFTNLFPDGLPIPDAQFVLPMPGDTSKYIIVHQTGNYNAQLNSTELYMTVIDMSLNGGLGKVIQKNNIFLLDTLDWGISACKHANGRDWWIVASRTFSDSLITYLLTPTGISYSSTQSFGISPTFHNVSQPTFSPDGSKFAFVSAKPMNLGGWYHEIRIFNFDRCNGTFTNLSTFVLDSIDGYSTAFSANSKYLYTSTSQLVYQINTDTINIPASKKIVAINDGYFSPVSPYQSDFYLLYLAANGKIYISSGNSVVDLHCIEQPDSSANSCNVLQHSYHLPCWSYDGNVCHPNYYLGPEIGSVCDSLPHVGLQEHFLEIQNFNISPNPISNGALKITYLLPQNKSGIFFYLRYKRKNYI